MDKIQSLQVIKNLIDIAVRKGVFENADEVLTTINAYNAIAAALTQDDNSLKQ